MNLNPYVGSERANPRKYLFIDGAFLVNCLKRHLEKMYGEFSIDACIDFSKIGVGYERIFFFDAYPSKKKNENKHEFDIRYDEKTQFFNKLNMIDNFHVRTGLTRREAGRGNRQKGVDILLAIEALRHAYSQNMDIASFMFSDLDFFPILESLTETRVKTEVFYDPRHSTIDLVGTADARKAISALTVKNWLHNHLEKEWQFRRKDDLIPSNAEEIKKFECGGIIFSVKKHNESFIAHSKAEGEREVYSRSNSLYLLLSSFEHLPDGIISGIPEQGFP